MPVPSILAAAGGHDVAAARERAFLELFPSSFAPVRVAHALCHCPGLINGRLRVPSLCVCLTFSANFPFRPCLACVLPFPLLPFRWLPMIRTRATRYSPLLCPPSVLLSALSLLLHRSLSPPRLSLPQSAPPPTHARTHTYTLRERPLSRACECGASEAAGVGGEVCGEQ